MKWCPETAGKEILCLHLAFLIFHFALFLSLRCFLLISVFNHSMCYVCIHVRTYFGTSKVVEEIARDLYQRRVLQI